jgi:hypothetical protein
VAGGSGPAVTGRFFDSERSCQGDPEGDGVYASAGNVLIRLASPTSEAGVGYLCMRGGVNADGELGLRSVHRLRTRLRTKGMPL